jgi:hypothetical protein
MSMTIRAVVPMCLPPHDALEEAIGMHEEV